MPVNCAQVLVLQFTIYFVCAENDENDATFIRKASKVSLQCIKAKLGWNYFAWFLTALNWCSFIDICGIAGTNRCCKAWGTHNLMSPVTSHVFWARCNGDSKHCLKLAQHNFLHFLLLSCLKLMIFFIFYPEVTRVSVPELVGWWDLFILQLVLLWICLQLTWWPALLWTECHR